MAATCVAIFSIRVGLAASASAHCKCGRHAASIHDAGAATTQKCTSTRQVWPPNLWTLVCCPQAFTMAATLCRVAAAARLGVVRGAARAPAAASAAVALATAAAATPLTTGVHAAAKVSGSGRAGYSSQAAQFSGVDAATRFADLVRSEAAPAEAQAVLDFWFEYKEGEAIDQRMWWWVSSDETDAAIRAKFETLVQKAQAGGQCGS